MIALLTFTHLAALGLGALAALLFTEPKSTKGVTKMAFLQVVEKIGEGIVKVFEYPVTEGGKIIALIKTAQVDGPKAAGLIDGLLAAAEPLGADAAVELAADGTNIGEYVKGLKDGEALVAYVKSTFMPGIKGIIADAKQDFGVTKNPVPVTAAGPAPAAPAPAVGAADSAPGLHKVVPA
jgi:hypothetical protein